jgi:hypothetical protein
MTDSPTAASLASTDLIDSAHPSVAAFARECAVGDSDRERAVALHDAVRDAFRYDPYRVDLSPDGMRASGVVRRGTGWCVPRLRCWQRPAGGGHSRARGVCRRAQPPEHRAHAQDDADRLVHLARLHRHLDRWRLAQGHAGVQPRAGRALRPAAAGLQRPRRLDLPPVRSLGQQAHGVRAVPRQFRRHAARRIIADFSHLSGVVERGRN